MSLVIEAKNYRGLVEIEWHIPPGLSVLVGANGAGKTTLLLLLEQLRAATSRNTGPEAILQGFGIPQNRYLGSAADQPVSLGVRMDDLHWAFDAYPDGDGVRPYCPERLLVGEQVIFERPAESPRVEWQGRSIKTDQRAIIRMLSDAALEGPFAGAPLLDALAKCRAYYNYNPWAIRHGSEESPHSRLVHDGTNVFSVLRKWRDKTVDRPREAFVIDALKECFGFFGGLDYEKGGDIIEGRVVSRKFPSKTFPLWMVANGWLVALLHFTAVAGADRGQVVGLDEFENALHPRAIRSALDEISAYAEARGISVVLTTQSPQVLDWFESAPEKVLVLDRGLRPGPRPLTDLRSQEWLGHFRLGREFADGDFAKETDG